MTVSRVQPALSALLVLILFVAITQTARQFERLDQRRLADISILGLALSATVILGIFAQSGADSGDGVTSRQVPRRFVICAAHFLLWIPCFLGDIWLLPASLLQAVMGAALGLAFLWYTGGLIRFLAWLPGRRITGSRF